MSENFRAELIGAILSKAIEGHKTLSPFQGLKKARERRKTCEPFELGFPVEGLGPQELASVYRRTKTSLSSDTPPRAERGNYGAEFRWMLDTNSLSKYEVVGERKDDDLPCFECDSVGPILIVKVGECTRDICHGCAKNFGIEW